MIIAENEPHEGKRLVETTWPIMRIHHQRSRYIFDLYHKRKAISKELFEYCCAQGLADRALCAKWRVPGYENLCCLRCIQPRETNFGTTCICRVPKHKLAGTGNASDQGGDKTVFECPHCGCRGCCG